MLYLYVHNLLSSLFHWSLVLCPVCLFVLELCSHCKQKSHFCPRCPNCCVFFYFRNYIYIIYLCTSLFGFFQKKQ